MRFLHLETSEQRNDDDDDDAIPETEHSNNSPCHAPGSDRKKSDLVSKQLHSDEVAAVIRSHEYPEALREYVDAVLLAWLDRRTHTANELLDAVSDTAVPVAINDVLAGLPQGMKILAKSAERFAKVTKQHGNLNLSKNFSRIAAAANRAEHDESQQLQMRRIFLRSAPVVPAIRQNE